ncbi:MAG: L-seryl-tRNA(Sec) selenium transferase [Thermoleophilia bacterium]
MDEGVHQVLRRLPGVDELLSRDDLRPLLETHPRGQVVEALRAALEAARRRVLSGSFPETWAELTAAPGLVAEAGRILDGWSRPHLRRVLNATGVVVHTNLGRSILSEAALDRVIEVARHYSTLEYDLEAGVRGSRHDHVSGLLQRLTGAEAAMVVNNNAGATLLMLAGLAGGGEVIVSRGQLVEIGGSFRIPDIMKLGGARLVEVGTTNKTRIDDYRAAMTSQTALLLRVHTSNFKVVGFTEEASIADLVALGREWGVPVADDLGSGALVDLSAFHDEPSVTASLRAGADVVSFSGDKLLGGPQAGILLGSGEAIERLRKHPLARALRVDKMTLAALEGTLQLYRDPEAAVATIPTLRFLDRKAAETERLAGDLLAELERRLTAAVGVEARVAVEPSTAKAGGGSLPLLELPSHAVVVRPAARSVVQLEAALREAPLPVVGRMAQDALYLDVLALEPEELPLVAESVVWALERGGCLPACETSGGSARAGGAVDA